MKKIIALIFLCSFSLISYSQSSLQDSLQLYYLFDGNANDLSGNEHNGSVYGATLTENRFGQENSAYEFDGYNDYINSYSTFDYRERSISLWVKPFDISGYQPYNHVAITQDDYRLSYGCMRVDFENDNIKLWSGGANNLYIDDADKMLDKWSHIVMTRNSDEIRYYVNAALVKTDLPNNIASTFEPDSNLIIGAGRSTYKQFFRGKIDDIRIYNRVLTEDEITRLFIYDIQVGVVETENNPLTIYPNPTTNTIMISINNEINNFSVEIINTTGKKLLSGKNNKTIDVSGLNNGLYFIKLINVDTQESKVSKFIKN
ncbi:MAG: hypothetical protein C0598_03700 [Marinilabiliales bacterium]|nr:MAG: hypothetical protein C0598_03700 [Marinilabiliales bacterium]